MKRVRHRAVQAIHCHRMRDPAHCAYRMTVRNRRLESPEPSVTCALLCEDLPWCGSSTGAGEVAM